jgi:hypothetical protein
VKCGNVCKTAPTFAAVRVVRPRACAMFATEGGGDERHVPYASCRRAGVPRGDWLSEFGPSRFCTLMLRSSTRRGNNRASGDRHPPAPGVFAERCAREGVPVDETPAPSAPPAERSSTAPRVVARVGRWNSLCPRRAHDCLEARDVMLPSVHGHRHRGIFHRVGSCVSWPWRRRATTKA